MIHVQEKTHDDIWFTQQTNQNEDDFILLLYVMFYIELRCIAKTADQNSDPTTIKQRTLEPTAN